MAANPTDEWKSSPMSLKEEKSRLVDILRAIDNIEYRCPPRFGQHGNDEDADSLSLLRLHLEQLCQAAEELCHNHEYDQKYPDIPWQQILAVRKSVADLHWDSDANTIKDVLALHIPVLKQRAGEIYLDLQAQEQVDKPAKQLIMITRALAASDLAARLQVPESIVVAHLLAKYGLAYASGRQVVPLQTACQLAEDFGFAVGK